MYDPDKIDYIHLAPFDQVKHAQYMKAVENKTVPTGWRKLLTTTGVESYRHKSVMDDYKPDPAPVYPSWTRKQALRSYPAEIPAGNFLHTTAMYVREFNKINHYSKSNN